MIFFWGQSSCIALEPEGNLSLFLMKFTFNLLFVSFLLHLGVATAFAARDILGNVLSGLAIQFSKPFSLGDTIKVCYQSLLMSVFC